MANYPKKEQQQDVLKLWVDVSAHSYWCAWQSSAFIPILLLVFFLTTISCRKPTTSSQSPASILLSNQTAISTQIAQGESHRYRIKTSPAQYGRIQIKHTGLYLRVTLYDPKGQSLNSFTCRQPGQIPVSFLTEQGGEYRLEIQSLETTAYTGNYRLEVVEQREKKPSDSQRLKADSALARAENFQSDMVYSALPSALTKYQEAQSIWEELGEKEEQAHALIAQAEIQQQLGKRDEAKKLLEIASGLLGNDQELAIEIQNRLLSITQDDEERGRQLLANSRKIGFRRGQALALDNLAEMVYPTGNRQLFRDYYLQSLPIWRELQERRKEAFALYSLGVASADLAEITQANEYYQRALQLWQSMGDKSGEAATLASMGHQQNLLGQKQQAMEFYEQALQAASASDDKGRLYSINNGIAFFYFTVGQGEKALRYYQESLQIKQEAQDQKGIAGILYVIGDVHQQLGHYDQAIRYFHDALAIIQKKQIGVYLPYVVMGLGTSYGALGKSSAAIPYLRQALELAEKNQDWRGAANAHNELGAIYRKMKRFDLAQQQHLPLPPALM